MRRFELDTTRQDSELERIDVAIKALWKLYRNSRWGVLATLGIERSRYEHLFVGFDLLYVTSDHGLIRREEQVVQLIAYCGAGIVESAVFMLRMHWLLRDIQKGMTEARRAL